MYARLSPPPSRRALAWVERESLLVSLFALSTALLFVRLPKQLQQDSWLTLVGGREVAHGSLPDVDRLTRWAHGARWVDQQWLTQLLFFRLDELGGIKLVMLGHVLLAGGALGLALLAARRSGGSARSVSLVAALALVSIVIAWQMRAQSLAYPLFVVVLWLLVADARAPSRRVFAVVPLLGVWANVHGSVLLGAGLVVLYGALVALRRAPGGRLRAVALISLPPACVFASPYALSLGAYYRGTVLNSSFGFVVTEWQATTLRPLTVAFYALLLLSVWLIGRHGNELTPFEKLALAATGAAGLLALRNIPWFALAALMILPRPFGRLLSQREEARSRARIAIPLGTCIAALAAAAVALAQPPAWYERAYPAAAATAVARAAERDPSLTVYADVRYADWLLWERPELAGRIAYDARLELLSRAQLMQLYAWSNRIGPDWKHAARGSRLLVLGRGDERAILAEKGTRALYRGAGIAVLLRSRR